MVATDKHMDPVATGGSVPTPIARLKQLRMPSTHHPLTWTMQVHHAYKSRLWPTPSLMAEVCKNDTPPGKGSKAKLPRPALG